ncbi:iron-containing redox enzyme family protein [Candidatus Woesearchaeota archaeon]|nr:iron-containing redox enzyme family protein [Candidatus Woesearchaeota archaeon]
MKEITPDDVITTFAREADSLDQALHTHHIIGALLYKKTNTHSVTELTHAYCRWLKMTEQYVRQTAPMLAAAGAALRDGDDEDKTWSCAFLHYKEEEIDSKGNYGHEVWATQGLQALNAPNDIMNAPEPWSMQEYKRFFVTNANQHPYAILGAKGILEHLSILNAPKLENALRVSGIQNIEKALQFINSHGVLDIDHVQEGNARIRHINRTDKLAQIILGAYVTSGSYRAFLTSV